MGASDVFVATSWFESQGLTVIEAMIYKMPNIASAVEDILDSIMHEKTDILINKCSSDKTAINVKRLVKSPMLAKRVSEKTHQLAPTKFIRYTSAQAFSILSEEVMQQKKGL